MTPALLTLSLLCALHSGAPPAQEPGAWTVLVYAGSDNDSEESFCPDAASLMSALGAEGLTVLAFVDRSTEYSTDADALGADFADARLFRFTREGAVRLAGGDEFPQIGLETEFEANSGDAGVLARAIRWAKATAPAKRYAVIFYSHGSGMRWCPDEASGDELFPAELTDVLTERDSVDLAVFDVCSMGGVENAYQWRPETGRFGIDVVVATPMAGFPFPWARIFARLGDEGAPAQIAPKDLDAITFGRIVVEETERHRRAELESGDLPPDLRTVVEGEAMACLDLRRAAAVKRAADELAGVLVGWFDGQVALEALIGDSTDPRVLHYAVPGEPWWLAMPYVDAFDLATRLATLDEAPKGVRARARALAHAVDGLVVASYGLGGYERFGGFQPGRHGVYVVLPDGDEPDEEFTRRWARFRWLHPGRPAEPGSFYGRYDWCGDGAFPDGSVTNWFELLDAWYDVEDGAGGLNGYPY